MYQLSEDCPSYDQVSTKNQNTFDSESAAQAAGYRKAGNCKKLQSRIGESYGNRPANSSIRLMLLEPAVGTNLPQARAASQQAKAHLFQVEELI
jgi:hypothetical protein